MYGRKEYRHNEYIIFYVNTDETKYYVGAYIFLCGMKFETFNELFSFELIAVTS